MKLSTRLILLVLGCLLPILAAQIYSQINLNGARQAQLSTLVLRQAELASANLENIVNAVAQLGVAAGQFPEVASIGPGCDERLTSLQRALPEYRFLAVYGAGSGGARLGGDVSESGAPGVKLLCGSDATPNRSSGDRSAWISDVVTSRNVEVGALVSPGTPDTAFLPIGIHLSGATATSDTRVLVAALDVGWLARQLAAAPFDHSRPALHATLVVADRYGKVVVRLPDSGGEHGQPLPEWEDQLTDREAHGVKMVTDAQGHDYIAAHLPMTSVGLTVLETMALRDVTADIDQTTYQDLLVISGAALVALILAWVAGHRFIYQPTEALLLASRKWREGDLSARAASSTAGSEFAALAQSFNAMAAGLQAREMERRLQSSFLEAQVNERTRALSESNNRLQVEIAGREKTEAALHQAQKLQAVGQLAGGIAHDFNNMLATVLGNLELMERRVSQTKQDWGAGDTERLMRLIGRATGAVQRGSQLTSRLLAFSRRQRLAARPTDVNALLRELITLATSTLGRRVQVVSELADEIWPAMVDPSQVEAAILNLCLNARDAMPDGGRLTISTANTSLNKQAEGDIRDTGLPPGGYVQICISDTGVGMTEEVKARAFDPFFTTKGPHGSGLGLSQVYGMAGQSGGDAIIDSTLGEGTRVTLLLPRAAQNDPIETRQTDQTANSACQQPMPSDLVLVVDDDAAVRQVTVEMVRDLGCEVAQAISGEQALALIGDLAPAPTLILLDYAMPGMNGLQLAGALRERGVKAPIALVTGYAELSETDITEAQLAGLLRKPFTIGQLHRLLNQLRANAAKRAVAPFFEPGLMDT